MTNQAKGRKEDKPLVEQKTSPVNIPKERIRDKDIEIFEEEDSRELGRSDNYKKVSPSNKPWSKPSDNFESKPWNKPEPRPIDPPSDRPDKSDVIDESKQLPLKNSLDNIQNRQRDKTKETPKNSGLDELGTSPQDIFQNRPQAIGGNKLGRSPINTPQDRNRDLAPVNPGFDVQGERLQQPRKNKPPQLVDVDNDEPMGLYTDKLKEKLKEPTPKVTRDYQNEISRQPWDLDTDNKPKSGPSDRPDNKQSSKVRNNLIEKSEDKPSNLPPRKTPENNYGQVQDKQKDTISNTPKEYTNDDLKQRAFDKEDNTPKDRIRNTPKERLENTPKDRLTNNPTNKPKERQLEDIEWDGVEDVPTDKTEERLQARQGGSPAVKPKAGETDKFSINAPLDRPREGSSPINTIPRKTTQELQKDGGQIDTPKYPRGPDKDDEKEYLNKDLKETPVYTPGKRPQMSSIMLPPSQLVKRQTTSDEKAQNPLNPSPLIMGRKATIEDEDTYKPSRDRENDKIKSPVNPTSAAMGRRTGAETESGYYPNIDSQDNIANMFKPSPLVMGRRVNTEEEGGYKPREDKKSQDMVKTSPLGMGRRTNTEEEGGYKPREDKKSQDMVKTSPLGMGRRTNTEEEGGYKPREDKKSQDMVKTSPLGMGRRTNTEEEGGYKPREDKKSQDMVKTSPLGMGRRTNTEEEGGYKPREDKKSQDMVKTSPLGMGRRTNTEEEGGYKPREDKKSQDMVKTSPLGMGRRTNTEEEGGYKPREDELQDDDMIMVNPSSAAMGRRVKVEDEGVFKPYTDKYDTKSPLSSPPFGPGSNTMTRPLPGTQSFGPIYDQPSQQPPTESEKMPVSYSPSKKLEDARSLSKQFKPGQSPSQQSMKRPTEQIVDSDVVWPQEFTDGTFRHINQPDRNLKPSFQTEQDKDKGTSSRSKPDQSSELDEAAWKVPDEEPEDQLKISPATGSKGKGVRSPQNINKPIGNRQQKEDTGKSSSIVSEIPKVINPAGQSRIGVPGIMHSIPSYPNFATNQSPKNKDRRETPSSQVSLLNTPTLIQQQIPATSNKNTPQFPVSKGSGSKPSTPKNISPDSGINVGGSLGNSERPSVSALSRPLILNPRSDAEEELEELDLRDSIEQKNPMPLVSPKIISKENLRNPDQNYYVDEDEPLRKVSEDSDKQLTPGLEDTPYDEEEDIEGAINISPERQSKGVESSSRGEPLDKQGRRKGRDKVETTITVKEKRLPTSSNDRPGINRDRDDHDQSQKSKQPEVPEVVKGLPNEMARRRIIEDSSSRLGIAKPSTPKGAESDEKISPVSKGERDMPIPTHLPAGSNITKLGDKHPIKPLPSPGKDKPKDRTNTIPNIDEGSRPSSTKNKEELAKQPRDHMFLEDEKDDTNIMPDFPENRPSNDLTSKPSPSQPYNRMTVEEDKRINPHLNRPEMSDDELDLRKGIDIASEMRDKQSRENVKKPQRIPNSTMQKLEEMRQAAGIVPNNVRPIQPSEDEKLMSDDEVDDLRNYLASKDDSAAKGNKEVAVLENNKKDEKTKLKVPPNPGEESQEHSWEHGPEEDIDLLNLPPSQRDHRDIQEEYSKGIGRNSDVSDHDFIRLQNPNSEENSSRRLPNAPESVKAPDSPYLREPEEIEGQDEHDYINNISRNHSFEENEPYGAENILFTDRKQLGEDDQNLIDKDEIDNPEDANEFHSNPDEAEYDLLEQINPYRELEEQLYIEKALDSPEESQKPSVSGASKSLAERAKDAKQIRQAFLQQAHTKKDDEKIIKPIEKGKVIPNETMEKANKKQSDKSTPLPRVARLALENQEKDLKKHLPDSNMHDKQEKGGVDKSAPGLKPSPNNASTVNQVAQVSRKKPEQPEKSEAAKAKKRDDRSRLDNEGRKSLPPGAVRPKMDIKAEMMRDFDKLEQEDNPGEDLQGPDMKPAYQVRRINPLKTSDRDEEEGQEPPSEEDMDLRDELPTTKPKNRSITSLNPPKKISYQTRSVHEHNEPGSGEPNRPSNDTRRPGSHVFPLHDDDANSHDTQGHKKPRSTTFIDIMKKPSERLPFPDLLKQSQPNSRSIINSDAAIPDPKPDDIDHRDFYIDKDKHGGFTISKKARFHDKPPIDIEMMKHAIKKFPAVPDNIQQNFHQN